MLNKLFRALSRTRTRLAEAIQDLVGQQVTAESLETLEEQLLTADMGVEMVESILDVIRRHDAAEFMPAIRDHLIEMLPEKVEPEPFRTPTVVLMVGVNGTGKTTTAAKLAALYKSMGQTVMLVAADTYRAAAVGQLKIWAGRAGCELVCNEQTREPSAVLFDGLKSAQAQKADVVIVDTAGRLHTYDNLMAELEKMFRVVEKRFPMFQQQNMITMDASLGQNSLIQAREFGRHVQLKGAILTKLDGTARGGIVFPLYQQLGIPVFYIGVGEDIKDLEPFDPAVYVNGLLGQGGNGS